MGKLYFSHSWECLAAHLMVELSLYGNTSQDREFGTNLNAFFRPGIILVPSSWMKQWLLLQLADASPSLGVAGFEIFSLQEGIKKLSPGSAGFTEIFCSLFSELSLIEDEAVINYCKRHPNGRTELAYRLALLFLRYGEHGSSALFERAARAQTRPFKAEFAELSDDLWQGTCHSIPERKISSANGGVLQLEHWEQKLLKKLFVDGALRFSWQILQAHQASGRVVHCFGFDFLTKNELRYFSEGCFYFFSPCAEYWLDALSDQEQERLMRFWRKKGAPLQKQKELRQYLAETPSLLANLGKLGRENYKNLDELDWEIVEDYPEQAIEETTSNLDRIRQSLLSFSQSDEKQLPDPSLVLLEGGASCFQELKQVYQAIFDLIENKGISPSDIAVFAPDIQQYAPLIETLFTSIPYRILGIESRMKSPFYQGLRRLTELCYTQEKWHPEDLIALLMNTSFRKKLSWDQEIFERLIEWLSLQDSLDDFESKLFDHAVGIATEPFYSLSLEEVGLWISLFQELEADSKAFLQDRSLQDWVVFLNALTVKYLAFDKENEEDCAFESFFEHCMQELAWAGKENKEALFPFTVISKLLDRPDQGGSIHASHLHALRVASLSEGMITPAKVIFLLGMDEESVPRMNQDSSLDLLRGLSTYAPSLADWDRYWFLQALFAAKQALYVSYKSRCPKEGREISPSPLTKGLPWMRDFQFNQVGASSNPQNVTAHDAKRRGTLQQSFSKIAWPKEPKLELPEGEKTVSIRDLKLLARNPWVFYLQKQLGLDCEEPYEENFYRQRHLFWQSNLLEPTRASLFPSPIQGRCGEALLAEWKEQFEPMHAFISEQSLQVKRLFLRLSGDGRQIDDATQELPALQLDVTDRLSIKIVGEIEMCSSQGFLSFKEPSIESFISQWPECLTALASLNAEKVFFLKEQKLKTVANPKKALQHFLKYYFYALSAPSPLIASWAECILFDAPSEWESKIRKKKEQDALRYPTAAIDWVEARADLPAWDELGKNWGNLLQESFSPLVELIAQKEAKQ